MAREIGENQSGFERGDYQLIFVMFMPANQSLHLTPPRSLRGAALSSRGVALGRYR